MIFVFTALNIYDYIAPAAAAAPDPWLYIDKT